MSLEPIVPDSSCLISLERIDQLHLLPALYRPVVSPPEVQREFGIRLPWLQLEAPSDKTLVAALGLLVDEGEAEAIALACERSWRVALDDRRARSVATRLGVRVIGTVGILVRAKQSALVSSLKPLLDNLESSGFHLGDALKREALRLAGE